MCSLVPRPSTPPAFDRLQYAKTEVDSVFAYWKRSKAGGVEARPGNEAKGMWVCVRREGVCKEGGSVRKEGVCEEGGCV